MHLKTIDLRANEFKIGDFVGINKFRSVFSKGYSPNLSNEIFEVMQVNRTNPTICMLQDENKNKIRGAYFTPKNCE